MIKTHLGLFINKDRYRRMGPKEPRAEHLSAPSIRLIILIQIIPVSIRITRIFLETDTRKL